MYLQRFFFFFFFFFLCVLSLMSAIGSVVVFNTCLFSNVRCGYNSRIRNCGMLVYNGVRGVHIGNTCSKRCAQCVQK